MFFGGRGRGGGGGGGSVADPEGVSTGGGNSPISR